MYEPQQAYCMEGFLGAIREGDIEAAQDWLIALAEYGEVDHERIVLDSLRQRHQIAQHTCEEHGIYCCSRCFDMTSPMDDEVDEIWAGHPMSNELHAQVIETETLFFEKEISDWTAQRDQLRNLPEVQR